MNTRIHESFNAQLVKERSVATETRRRLSPYLFETIPAARQSEYEADGWVQDHKLKRSVVMRRLKPHSQLFEDRTWAAFARLQFPILNKKSPFNIAPSAPTLNGQVETITSFDVFAADDEVALVALCRSAEDAAANSFRQEIEAIQACRAEALRSLRNWIPNRKVKFILATNNFIVSEATIDRLKAADIVHMDEDTIDYYLELAEHLGPAARYQLLGSMFAGSKIPGLESRVAAIQGKMGGHIYYSFMIEPARLLKLGYILHRHKANSELMPTYQRIIRKTRLKSIAQFVDNGGFFPNSIIVNIEAGARGLQFDRAATAETEARVGVLHLPQTYRAAYIIDGQHRLYGYAGSHRSETDLIPVVAFLSLPRASQVELFMQINENQQAVPKNLRNTLNAELLYESPDAREQTKALKLRIAQRLEEHRASPLRGRIIIGEEKASALRCITIDSISLGLDRGNFIGSPIKASMREPGTFYRGGNDPTLKVLFPFLELSFAYLRDHLQSQWALGKADGGFVFVNNGIESLLRVLSDVVDHLVARDEIYPRADSTEDVFAKVQPYLDPLISFLAGINYAEAGDFRRLYGSAGRARYWRKLQTAINVAIPEFNPAGLAEYHEDEDRAFNTEAFRMINDIEKFLKVDIRRRLEDHFHQAWITQGIPVLVYKEASALAIEKNFAKGEGADPDDVEPWDCLHLINYLQILQKNSKNWEDIFQEQYSRPRDKSGNWKTKTAWLQELNRIRNIVSHAGTVKESEYNFVVGIHTWLGLRRE